MTLLFRTATRDDIAQIIVLNEAALPAVNSVDAEGFAWFQTHASYFRVVVNDNARSNVLGFLIGLEPGAPYESLNYRWFSEHFESFMYVDRIVVDAQQRGCGIGESFYQDLANFSEGHCPRITCEVNKVPPNPGSMRFHTRLGFAEVGEQHTEGGKKTVALLSRDC